MIILRMSPCRLLAEGSPQTKDAAARSLSQMMVEESIRGIAIQQGLIKACCAVVMDADTQVGHQLPEESRT